MHGIVLASPTPTAESCLNDEAESRTFQTSSRVDIVHAADRDPGLDTFASPELWTAFADFYKRASGASKIAFDASRAKRVDEFKALVAELRTACNACHANYLKTQ